VQSPIRGTPLMRTRHRHGLPGPNRVGGRMPSKALICLLAGAATVLLASPARGAPIDVIRDCSEDGTLEKRYSHSELSGALGTLPSDLDEYTDCRGVIRRAQLSGVLGKGRNGVLGGVDSSAQPSRHEQKEITEASSSSPAVEVGKGTVRPGHAGGPIAGAALGTDLPTGMLATLVGMAAATLWAAGYAVQRRWPAAWRGAGTALAGPARRIGDGVKRGISRFRR
jgi:hypothetical protein